MWKKIGSCFGTLANFAVCTALLPFVLLLFLYRQNIEYLSLWQVLLLCLGIAASLLIIYFTVRFLCKVPFAAFVLTAVLFLSFFMFRALFFHFSALLAVMRVSEAAAGTWAAVLNFAGLFALCVAYAARIAGGIAAKFPGRDMRAEMPLLVAGLGIMLYLALRALYDFALGLCDIDTNGKLFFGAVLCLALALACVAWKFRTRLRTKTVPVLVTVLLGALLLQNAAGIIAFMVAQRNEYSFYKEDFTVDVELARQPSVYWFHCDGMLGFDAYWRFYNDDQAEFVQALENRGFFISREAVLAAGSGTASRLPALMNPYYYDRVMAWSYAPDYARVNPQNEDLLRAPINWATSSVAMNLRARQKNETVAAFSVAGYNTSTLSPINQYFFPVTRQFYTDVSLLIPKYTLQETLSFTDTIFRLKELIDLLSSIAPLRNHTQGDAANMIDALEDVQFHKIALDRAIDLFPDLPPEHKELHENAVYPSSPAGSNRYANCLVDILSHPGPKFTLFNFDAAHVPFRYTEWGVVHGYSEHPLYYPSQHAYTRNTLLKYVDMILEKEPDAVIVLQADHGIHTLVEEITTPGSRQVTRAEVMDTMNVADGELDAIRDQVMSAVRLPEEKLTPETKEILSDPRNISRYIVNEYVGQNYEYIPASFRQISVGPEPDRYMPEF